MCGDRACNYSLVTQAKQQVCDSGLFDCQRTQHVMGGGEELWGVEWGLRSGEFEKV